MWNKIVKKKVADFIGKNGLLSHEGLHLVALSGGADSVALLLILKDLGYRIEAAHCNFHLRGEESDRDEEFVKDLCTKENIPLHLIHFDTKEYASLHQVSIEMAARDLRYGYFRQLIKDLDAETVCLAHHRDDAVETFIMNLMRGSGIHGLTGIRSLNDKIVRPLLCVSRQEIEDYLHSIGQRYVVDSTNLIDDVLRNKIRLNVLPLLEQLNPNVADNIGKSAQFLQETEKVVEAAIAQQKKELVKRNSQQKTEAVSIVELKQLPSPELFLHEWLAEKGFNSTQVEQLSAHLEGSPGRIFEAAGYTLYIDREHLVLAPHEIPMKPLRIPEAGHYRINETICMSIKESNNIFISKSADCVTIDKVKVRFPLTIRLVENGDSFIPYGMTGKKLVSDYLTDIKCSLLEKRSQMVIEDSEGQIIWLIGKRIDNRFRVTEQTSQVLQMTLINS
jgi:tRNA(Ile)-lysidine synthase